MFEDAGYEVPHDAGRADGAHREDRRRGQDQPWCAGIESGDATGWPATDFLEDMVLRTAGPEVYDQWVTHEIPFNDPRSSRRSATAGEILKNPDYVNGGLGDVRSIAAAPWNEAGNGIPDGTCSLHRAANFYQANWHEALDGRARTATSSPSTSRARPPTSKPLLGGGEFVDRLQRPPRGPGLPRLPVQPAVG